MLLFILWINASFFSNFWATFCNGFVARQIAGAPLLREYAGIDIWSESLNHKTRPSKVVFSVYKPKRNVFLFFFGEQDWQHADADLNKMNNNGDNPPSSGDALIDEQQIHHQQQLAQQQQQAEQQIQHQLPPQQEEVHDHANKRPRDEYLGEGHEINELANAVHQQAHEEYSHPLGETEESLLKKAKLDAEAEGSMVMAVMEEHYKAENSHLTSTYICVLWKRECRLLVTVLTHW